MTKQALKLALEALTYIYTETTADEDELIDQAITAIKEALAQTQDPVAFASHGVINWIADKQFQHEADLYTTSPQPKEPKQEPVAWEQFYPDIGKPKFVAQPEQEPVAYIRVSKTGNVMACAKTRDFYKLPDKTFLYTSPQPARVQEPVAWMFQHEETGRMNYVSNDGIHDPTMFLGMNPQYALVCPLYTTPPQRTWVGLTDDEIEKGRDQTFSINNPYCPCDSKTMRKAVRWAEAKLKHKNTRVKE